MASAIQHYREAEKLLDYAGERDSDSAVLPLMLAEAQVHATLALAGAAALQAYTDGSEQERETWADVAGDTAQDGGES